MNRIPRETDESIDLEAFETQLRRALHQVESTVSESEPTLEQFVQMVEQTRRSQTRALKRDGIRFLVVAITIGVAWLTTATVNGLLVAFLATTCVSIIFPVLWLIARREESTS